MPVDRPYHEPVFSKDEIQACMLVYLFQVHHLLKVLSKKRDPVTHVCFMEEVLRERKKSRVLTFWESITVTLREEFIGAAQSESQSIGSPIFLVF